jgi:integrase
MDQTTFTNFVAHTPDLSAASEPAAPRPASVPQPRPLLKTFADVDAYICGHPDWSLSGRGPLRSSCRRAAWSVNAIHAARRNEPFDPDMKQLDLATVPFDVALINAAWKGRSYRAAGFTSKSAFRNARWAVRHIGRVAGTVLPCFAPPLLPSDPFEPLLQTANKYDKTTTRLFAAWCRERGLCPGDINDDALLAYEAYMLAHMVGRKAGEVIRLIARLWNDTARRDPAWSQTKLSAPSGVTPPFPPFTAYPVTLQEHIAGFKAWMAGTRRRRSPDRRPGRKRAARPATIINVLGNIRLALGALVAGGRDPMSLTDLGCLMNEPDLEAILLFHEKRAEAKQQALPEADRIAPALPYAIGAVLLMIAQRYCELPAETLKPLREIVGDFRRPSLGKPTWKNRGRVNELIHDRIKLRLLMRLPATLMKKALELHEESARTLLRADQTAGSEAARLTRKAVGLATQAAYLAREAVAIGILCRIPLRIKNLDEIRIGTNLRFTGGRSDIVTLNFIVDETKNRIDLEFYIGPRLHALLQTYIAHFLPFFAADSADRNENRWLFPSGDGRPGPLSIGRLRTIIVRTVADNVGVTINPHLFRALAVTLALEHSPDALDHCRQLLGDKSLTVVLRHYAMTQEKEAARRQSAFVDAEEDRLLQLSAPSSTPRRGRRS